MKRLIIKSEKHGEMYRDFETEAEIQEFIDASGDHYGHLDYTEIIPAKDAVYGEAPLLEPEVLDENGVVITPAVYGEAPLLQEAQPEQSIFHPATVSYEVVDVTAQINKEKAIAKNLARMEFGQQIMAELAAMNQSALESSQTTVQNILAAEEKLAKVQRLLLNGSLGLAYQILSSLDVPELGTQLKTYFINKIKTYLDNE